MPTFDLHIMKNNEFYHFVVLLNLKLFHVPGILEPRNWVENRAMYTPFSIRAFGSFTDIIPCRENADFRATFSGIDKIDIEILSFPALLNLKLFHVPGMLEPRNWVENWAMYTPLSISSFGSFTDTVRSCENADFRPPYYVKWRIFSFPPYFWSWNVFMFPVC